jgi:outer membrane protein TolC
MKRIPRILLTILGGLSYAQAQGATETLGLDAFINTILEKNPGVQLIITQICIAEADLQASQSVDDPVVSSRGTLSQTEPDRINGFEADRSRGAGVELSLDRLYSATGTRLGIDYGNQYTNRDPASLSLGARYYQPSLTLRLTQPLLKNAGGIQDRLNVELSALDRDLASLQSSEQLESYITRLAALYLDWYLAYRQMTISEGVYKQSLEQEKLVKLKVRRQVAEPYELYRARETRADYYARWQQDTGTYKGLTRQVMTQLLLDDSGRRIEPQDPATSRLLTAAAVDPDYLATDSRLKAILDNLRSRQETLLSARSNARKPDLNLSLSYTRHGADSGFVDAQTGELSQNDLAVVLEYQYPLGNRAALGRYQSQLASQQQVNADTAQQLIDARAALADLDAQQEQLVIALTATDEKIDLADRKLREEQRLYKIGELDLFQLIQDQTAQLESRLKRERLYVQLQQIRLSIGELLDRNLRATPSPRAALNGEGS